MLGLTICFAGFYASGYAHNHGASVSSFLFGAAIGNLSLICVFVQVCLEFKGIEKGGSAGFITETHAVADDKGNVVRHALC